MSRRSPLIVVLGLLIGMALAVPVFAGALTTSPPVLDVGARIAAQRAVEGVYWDHRLWPDQNAGRKPALDAVVSASDLRDKVARTLRPVSYTHLTLPTILRV